MASKHAKHVCIRGIAPTAATMGSANVIGASSSSSCLVCLPLRLRPEVDVALDALAVVAADEAEAVEVAMNRTSVKVGTGKRW